MNRRFVLDHLVALAVGVLLLGCGRQNLPAATTPLTGTEARSPAATRGAAPTATSVPPTALPIDASPSPSSSPAPATGTSRPATGRSLSAPPAFFLGVPAGDAYAPASLAVDQTRQLAYVYSAQSAAGGAAISVVDLASHEVVQLIRLGGPEQVGDGRVLVAPDGLRGYVVDVGAATLTMFDPRTGTLGARLKNVRDAVLSPDGVRLFILGSGGLTALDADDLTPLWTVDGTGFSGIAASADRVAVSQTPTSPALGVYDSATGEPVARTVLPDSSQGLAPGPAGGWAVRLWGSPPRLVRFDASLSQVADIAVPWGDGLFYDAGRHRYLLGGYDSEQGKTLIRAYAESNLALLSEQAWPVPLTPNVFAANDKDELLALARFGNSRLTSLDPETLAPAGHTILGVVPVEMTLDEAAGTLFVADNQGRIHLLSVPGGQVRAVWTGEAPIALDPANHRLYVNRESAVEALDSRTGEVLARYAQGGVPAPDPQRDLVYIVETGVTIYDRSGQRLGQLDSTFPRKEGFSPNPFAYAARVNPVSGSLAVALNNGVPGSNNSSYLRLYPPAADEPIDVPGTFSFLYDIAFDPISGNLYASYSNAKNLEALQLLSPTGQEVKRLGGRFGHLAFDATTNLLYVAQAGALARVRGDTLSLLDLYQAPEHVAQLLLDERTGQLFFRRDDRPQIGVAQLDALPALDMRPRPVAGLPDEQVDALAATADARGLLLYATVGTDIYRSRDGQQWQILQVGSLPINDGLTVAGPGVLFRAGQGSQGGDGVFRSRDAGESWELLAEGLVDLRTPQRVVARGADEAYFVGKTGGIFTWRPAEQRWERILGAEEGRPPGELFLAPDGTLFLQGYGRLRRSDDGGKSWRELVPPADSGQILGFSPHYTQTQTLYALFGSGERHVMRSRDAGLTWALADSGLTLPPYVFGLELTGHEGTLYLYRSDYSGESQLFRSFDEGSSWQAADPESVRGTVSLAVAPDGRLWLGLLKGGIRSLAAPDVAWAESRSLPPAPPASPPAPPTARCNRVLDAGEAAAVAAVPELGCPTGEERAVAMARQPFEHGEMIWRSDQRTILVLTAGGSWRQFPDQWQEGQPEWDPGLQVPAGRQQPKRGFGQVWREQLGGPAASIGWATEEEQPVAGRVQVWDGGLLVRFEAETVVLLESGAWQPLP
ncbi:MAG: hypothetical protein M5U01_29250 [Ardenticatenaceae bacterium]|nr:hypothetical protein [Ardenticatenaceae bacterium]